MCVCACVRAVLSTLRTVGCAIYAAQPTRRHLRGAFHRCSQRVADSIVRAVTPHTRPQLGLKSPRDGDRDECSALAWAALRPR
eukprot:7739755-Pyramimonas_sp.AAC.1